MPRPNFCQRSFQATGNSRPAIWLFSHTLHHLDRAILRLSGGRVTATSLLGGLPMVTVATTGARSGQPRSVPLIAIPTGDDLVLVASNWGKGRHPAWYYNVCAHPQVAVTQKGVTRSYVAREVRGEERERLWQTAVAVYAGYAAYVQRAGNRRIPVLLLSPQPE